MNKEQIIEALVPLYNDAYDDYVRLSELSIQLLNEDEDRAYRAIARKVSQKSNFLDGIKASAEALGITTAELLSAAACQQRKEEIECQELN